MTPEELKIKGLPGRCIAILSGMITSILMIWMLSYQQNIDSVFVLLILCFNIGVGWAMILAATYLDDYEWGILVDTIEDVSHGNH